ncbi:MAG: magnesium protoporphyrin IX methyltransferase [Rhodobacterales bacterium]|nr:magnesium protoporphyrin IX methyltransferase [Rhodobacterales bacterium]
MASASPAYDRTRARVEAYFDRTATRVWERLTSDQQVSRIRQTVREGRDRMRGLMLDRLPADLTGRRVLDAGCGTGAMAAELARRGAEVLAVDLSPRLIEIARDRMDPALAPRVRFAAGDLADPAHGQFDHVAAMDSLIYYDAPDLVALLDRLGGRTAESIVFTVAPRTPLLMAMWGAGRLFPASDRSPRMVPHSAARLGRALPGVAPVGRVARGFYISECLEHRP